MAFWAVFGKWWYKRTDIENQIVLFKKYLYDQWYNSLSADAKDAYDKLVQQKEEMKRKETEAFIKQYDMIRNMIASKSSSYFL